jgi:hypothetical protein
MSTAGMATPDWQKFTKSTAFVGAGMILPLFWCLVRPCRARTTGEGVVVGGRWRRASPVACFCSPFSSSW